jgi:hypothetical protein
VSAARWQVSTAGGVAPLWSHSGHEIFFKNNAGDLVSAQITTSPSVVVGAQRPLFTLQPFASVGSVPLYAITPDDKRFLMMRETTAGESGLLVVSEHWFEDLKARAQK